MKKMCLQFQKNGTKRFFELFNFILEKSEYNLNQFVKSDSLAIPDEIEDNFIDALKEFLNISPNIVKEIDDKKTFWMTFQELDDYENNEKFVKWLVRYVDAAIKPYEDAAFVQRMDETAFENMTKYCFENLILKDIGKKNIDKLVWDEKQIIILRKIMFTFIEMVIYNNFSKENAFGNMERMFGIKENYCEKWWELVIQNKEKLWKIMLVKQYNRIESKLDRVLEAIED